MRSNSQLLIAVLACLLGTALISHAGIVRNMKSRSLPTIQADRLRVGSINTQSNIEFWQTNYGEMFLDIHASPQKSGTFWPRGYGFPYIFGGGFWFGAQKNNVRHVLVGYDPASGGSWFQPGSVAATTKFYDSVKVATNKPKGRYPGDADAGFAQQFTILYSTDYDKVTGIPLVSSKHLPNWPIWDTTADDNVIPKKDHYFGSYIEDTSKRNLATYPARLIETYSSRFDSALNKVVVDTAIHQKGGPVFISEEDMFTICNDVDLTNNDGSSGRAYPLSCEVQRMIYSWGSEVNKNYIFIVYKIINHGADALDSCWLAPVMDADIGSASAPGDENGYYSTDSTLNLAIQWSDKEAKVPLSSTTTAYPGVIGMDFLESPTVYKPGEVTDNNLIGTIKPGAHPNSEQLGLVRFKRWLIGSDPTDDDGRYNFMSARIRDTAQVPPEYSDKRFLMATGPFKILPGQTAQIVVGLMIARDSSNGDANIDASKLACVALDKRAQIVYDSNFAVPAPPDEPTITDVKVLSSGTRIKWDTRSEYSYDPIGAKLDFMGYRLFRGRHDLVGENNSTLYDKWKNPYGYKMLKEWKLTDIDTNSHAYQWLMNADSLPPENAPRAAWTAVYDTIHKVMDQLTNHNTFFDFGDDDHDGVVSENEKLINDVDYYYWIAAFDQGDPNNGVVSQQTNGKIGQSKLRTHPVSSYAGDNSTYMVYPPSDSLGGISHFQWRVQNQEVINQLLAGDTLKVSFTHHLNDPLFWFRMYGFDMHVQDLSKAIDYNYQYIFGHEIPVLYSCGYVIGTATPTLAVIQPLADTSRVKSMVYGSDKHQIDVVERAGLFTSVDTGFAPNQYLLNAIEHSMNYKFYQTLELATAWAYVDSTRDTIVTLHTSTGTSDTSYSAFRRDTLGQPFYYNRAYNLAVPTARLYKHKPAVKSVTKSVLGGDTVYRYTTKFTQDTIRYNELPFGVLQGTDTCYMSWDPSFTFDSTADMGQYDYDIEFVPGGVETVTLAKDKNTYRIPYLNLKVHAVQTYVVSDSKGSDSTVMISSICKPADKLADNSINAGTWSMDPTVWHLAPGDTSDDFAARGRQFYSSALNSTDTLGFSHSLNRYYLTAFGGAANAHKLFFVNRLSVGGNTIFIDSAVKENARSRRTSSQTPLPGMFRKVAASDFKVGDVIRVRYSGGILGLPTPGASFNTLFTPSVPQEDSSKVTAGQLANVHVWPNPYIVGNSVDPNAWGMQKPSLSDRLVFNHLPPQCKITLFNIAGELIRTLNHNGGSEEYWDLLSEGRQRVGSQLIVAQVTSNDGSEKQILKIAVIVQGR